MKKARLGRVHRPFTRRHIWARDPPYSFCTSGEGQYGLMLTWNEMDTPVHA